MLGNSQQQEIAMKIWSSILIASAVIVSPMLALADETNLSFGGDQYTAGQQAGIETDVARDAFIAGYTVSISAPVQGDGHLAGFNVSTTSPVTEDVYAAGYSVTIGAPVGGDSARIWSLRPARALPARSPSRHPGRFPSPPRWPQPIG
jgi:hypothetical protein